MPAMVRTGSPFINSASCALSCYVSSLLSVYAGRYTQHSHSFRNHHPVQAENAPTYGGFPWWYMRQSDTIDPSLPFRACV